MKNINKISLVGGAVFAIGDAICAFLATFALQPFMIFWSYIAHIRLTGAAVESVVSAQSVIGGLVSTFILGFVLTWIFVWLHRKFCCESAKEQQ